jgi:hypothetical protein
MALKLPKGIVVLSCIFFAYHFCPVAALLVCLCVRMFLELMYFFLAMDSWWISLSSLFLIGHGLVYLLKILVDSTCDFFSFQISNDDQFLNDNAREKIVRYLRWASYLNISDRTVVVCGSIGTALLISFTYALMRIFNVDLICSTLVCAAIFQQSC